MPKRTHIEVLAKGSLDWNAWRLAHPQVVPDLTKASFEEISLRDCNLKDAKLMSANLSSARTINSVAASNVQGRVMKKKRRAESALKESYILRGEIEVWVEEMRADLRFVDFSESDMRAANLRGASLVGADLSDTDLSGADLSWTKLSNANLSRANLRHANLENAIFHETIFNNTILSHARGLSGCNHWGPSSLDHRTMFRSGYLPESFLMGCGVPRILIDYMPSLLTAPLQFFTCFISYSKLDEGFAEQIYRDLRTNEINCWYAPQDMKIGDRIRDSIDRAIVIYDKLLLILSEHSINSDWVEKEVETAFEKERRTKTTVLFPIMLDDAVMKTDQAWAADIRRTRHIGSFQKWKIHNEYQKSLAKLLRDLSKEQTDTDSNI